MTIRNRPDYGVYYIALTNAGSMDIPCIGTRVMLAAAWSGASLVSLAGGVQSISGGSASAASVNCQIGKALGDAIGMQIGSEVVVENKFDFVRLSWPAQAGIIAELVISDDADGNGVHVHAAPTISLGTLSVVQGGNTLTVNADGSSNDRAVPYVTETQQANRVGDSFSNNLANSTGATTIVAAASNVNGIILRGNSILTQQTASQNSSISIGASAPTSNTSNENLLLVDGIGTAQLGHDLFIPAGNGLYQFASASATGGWSISYKVL